MRSTTLVPDVKETLERMFLNLQRFYGILNVTTYVRPQGLRQDLIIFTSSITCATDDRPLLLSLSSKSCSSSSSNADVQSFAMDQEREKDSFLDDSQKYTSRRNFLACIDECLVVFFNVTLVEHN